MYNDILLASADSIKATSSNLNEPVNSTELFITFLNKLEGWKTRCKNLHWSAPKKNIHEYLDDFLDILSDYQDGLAEEIMGITDKFQPNILKGIPSGALNAFDFIDEVKMGTLAFYDRIPQDSIYKGVTSECETFIHNINKYIYLFKLSDTRLY